MVSQNGYVGSTSSTNPSANGFTPNLSLDGISGTIHARQGSIGGFELTKNYLQSTESGTGGNRNLILNGTTGKLTANDATIKGRIEATSGSFPSSLMTGVLTADKINFNGAKGIDVDLSGKITATSGTFSGSLSGATGTFSGELSAATGTFSGHIEADSGTIKNVTITDANIGKWNIVNGSLYSDYAVGASIIVEQTGGRFLRINESPNSAMLGIRSDSDTALSIYTQGSAGVGISILAQGGRAIDSSGSHEFYQRSGETWNAPGMLMALTLELSRMAQDGYTTNIFEHKWHIRTLNEPIEIGRAHV